MLQRRTSFATEALRYGLIVLALGFIVFPILWMVVTSFKPARRRHGLAAALPVHADARQLRPRDLGQEFPVLYQEHAVHLGDLDDSRRRVRCARAYSFARYNVGDGHILFFILSTKMFPAIAVILPYFLIFRETGQDGRWPLPSASGWTSRGALIISYTMFNLPFAIWLLVSFFQDIPRELEHSARLDGLSRMKVLRKVVFPLAAPGIAVTGVFTLIFCWNEFLFAYILTRKEASTITVGVEILLHAARHPVGAGGGSGDHQRAADDVLRPADAALHGPRPDLRRGEGVTP
jgi:multiple sugar transport system permease protein